jgi:hypothetical protein
MTQEELKWEGVPSMYRKDIVASTCWMRRIV